MLNLKGRRVRGGLVSGMKGIGFTFWEVSEIKKLLGFGGDL